LIKIRQSKSVLQSTCSRQYWRSYIIT